MTGARTVPFSPENVGLSFRVAELIYRQQSCVWSFDKSCIVVFEMRCMCNLIGLLMRASRGREECWTGRAA